MRSSTRSQDRRPPRRPPRLLWAAGAIFASAALIAVVVAGYIADDGNGVTTAAPGGAGVGNGQPVGIAGGAIVRLASWSGGGAVDLSRPGKPAVVLAMAGWCSTCVPPARDLKAVHEEFGDRVLVIAVSVDPGETEGTLSRFRHAAGDPAYLWGFDDAGKVAHTFELRYLDTVVVLDARGNQLHKSVRPSNDELRRVLANALGEAK